MKDWEKNYDDRIGRPHNPELDEAKRTINALKIENNQLKQKIEELQNIIWRLKQ